ncbi:MAG: DUF6088 family protein [Chitinophagaceae bacterium]
MEEKSVENKLLDFIYSKQRGKTYNASDFSYMGADEAVRKALQRLEKQGKLIRISPGLYLFPKTDPLLGIMYPSLAEIATDIARKEKLRIIPTGDQALLQLGLSTQVPMKSIYLTDGGPRNFKIGNRVLVFKPTTPKNLSLQGKISGLIIQALKTLGKDRITEEIRSKIRTLLAAENPIIAESDATLAPAWIRTIIMNIIKSN